MLSQRTAATAALFAALMVPSNAQDLRERMTSRFEPAVQDQIENNMVPGIGLSWFLSEHNGFRTVSHGGGDRGFRSNFVMVPGSNLAVLLVSNSDKSPVQKLTKIALDIALEPNER
jgi:hypothetical protein